MSRPGDFSAEAREAIMEASGNQCVGCGRTSPLNTQHRRARGMGGTRVAEIGSPVNGVILCGSGTTGCHGWAESHPIFSRALGWSLRGRANACEVPWWTRFGRRRWNPDLSVTWLGDDEVPEYVEQATEAITAYSSRMRAV